MLQGFTVGITADRRWEEQAALFESQGATVVHGASLRSAPIRAVGALREVTEGLIKKPADAFVANTAMGMQAWMQFADRSGLGADLRRSLARSRIYARGPKAAAAVEEAGLPVAGGSRRGVLVDVIDRVLADGGGRSRVVVLNDGGGPAPEIERLQEAGSEVLIVPAYEWHLPEDWRPAIRLAEGVMSGRVHAITFTARPAVRNWFALATREGIQEPLRQALASGGVVVGCVGVVCAQAAVDEGIDVERLVVPASPRLVTLVEAIGEQLLTRVVRTGHHVGEAEVVITGTVATIDGVAFSLTPTEARLLAALASRPNTVVSPEDLLQSVWDGSAHDPHLVEVVVARLRRALGDHGQAITSVPRRGYALRA
jgi:uroporphyrinogen-III synthase